MPERETPVDTRAARRPIAAPSRGRSAPASTPERRVVVVGAAGDVPRALQHPAVVNGHFTVTAVIAVDVEHDTEQTTSVTTLNRLLSENAANTILIAGPVGATTMRRVADVALLRGCALLAVMPTEVLTEHDPVVVWSGESPLVRLGRRRRGGWQVVAKRGLDMLGASVGLVIATPVLALLSALVCLESRGAPIFTHERIGRGGKRFGCLKLRTMRLGAEEELRADPELLEQYKRNHFKIPDDRDPRITRLGRFLRRTSLDEVPQLWNVLKGDMSLVGPRPVVEDELSHYEHSRDLLLSVRPGVTGAWAVGGRHGVGYPDRCEMELRYVREWTVLNDMKVLAATVTTVLR
jgi:lipopolysaccharide/colanic/teichoic acid biosynthesis glycosyltransferase